MKEEYFKELLAAVKEATQLIKIHQPPQKVYKLRQKWNGLFYGGGKNGRIWSKLCYIRCSCNYHSYLTDADYEIVEYDLQESKTIFLDKNKQ